MWASRTADHQRIVNELVTAKGALGLKGLPDAVTIDTLAMQFIASMRREAYYRVVQTREVGPKRADPNSPSFDPERAVAFHMSQGNVNEAGWLIFLMTHFARPLSGWQRLKDVYGRLGAGPGTGTPSLRIQPHFTIGSTPTGRTSAARSATIGNTRACGRMQNDR